jgi:hypothetical protein
MENEMRTSIYAIKTDGLRYYITDCKDEDDTVEATLSRLAKEQAHRDTVRFDLVPQVGE